MWIYESIDKRERERDRRNEMVLGHKLFATSQYFVTPPSIWPKLCESLWLPAVSLSCSLPLFLSFQHFCCGIAWQTIDFSVIIQNVIYCLQVMSKTKSMQCYFPPKLFPFCFAKRFVLLKCFGYLQCFIFKFFFMSTNKTWSFCLL